jgi:RNA polymerase sigma-70 factor, ECF subfamily
LSAAASWYHGAVVEPSVEACVQSLLGDGNYDRAATALINGYGPRILGYLRGVLRDEDLAGDAFSQFGENVWRGIAGFRGDASLLAWAFTVAWSAVCRVTDSAYVRRRARLETSEAERIVCELRSATQPFQQTDVKDAVAELRNQLRADEQTLLFLRVDQGMPWSELATVLGAEPAALRKRFERVKEKLRVLARSAGLLERA